MADKNVKVTIDGIEYTFTRYALSHMVDSLLGYTDGAAQWSESAENPVMTPEEAADCKRLAVEHERMAAAFRVPRVDYGIRTVDESLERGR